VRLSAAACLGLAALLCAGVAAAQDFATWRYVRQIQFNTSGTGADVYYDVHDYPVAVALEGGDFDFTQAKEDGSDLRFSLHRDGGLLPYAIDHWDPAGRRGLVWVKVPTVIGRSTSQSIYLQWGNSAAAAAGDSHEVFATRDGFVGVWHLDEDAGSDTGGYRDATASAAHGTGVNLAAAPSPVGRLGRALSLRHADAQWVRIDPDARTHFDLTTRLTFSIWARATSYANRGNEATGSLAGYETLIAKGDNSWRLQKFGIRDWHTPPADLIEICVEQPPRADLCAVGRADVAPGEWFHLAGVHDFPLVKLYVNGALDAVEIFDVNWKSGDHPVGIGNQTQFPDAGRSWDGLLDEARVMRVPKDDYWLKLEYESQREGQRFLTFGATERRF
jgi:hypothetical protein